MAYIAVACPRCKTESVVKFGTNSAGKQRYQCKNNDCTKNTFLLEYSPNGDLPEVKRKIVEMAINGSGIRDTARVLNISVNTVISELKKRIMHRNY